MHLKFIAHDFFFFFNCFIFNQKFTGTNPPKNQKTKKNKTKKQKLVEFNE